ncbi:MAG: hypothetical protein QXY39_01910 [Thermofilaceae archaeon]
MEAELVARISQLLSQGRIEDASYLSCWLYAYWRLSGYEQWRLIHQTGCIDNEISSLLIGKGIDRVVAEMEVAFSFQPSIPMLAKLFLAEALTGREVNVDVDALGRLLLEHGFDELYQLARTPSLTRLHVVAEKPWLILAQSPRFRQVALKWLGKARVPSS